MDHAAPTVSQQPFGFLSFWSYCEEVDGNELTHVVVEKRLPGLRSTLYGRSRDTVRSEISIPSFKQLPWMRGVPQSRLAAAVFLINTRTSGLASGRPLRFFLEIEVQKRRKPFRCQETTVSGFTMINARCQSFQLLESRTQKRRSALRSRGRGPVPLEHRKLLAEGQILPGHYPDVAGPDKEANQ
jgi:hypothetical protein